jgi:4-carboxymuconolactone decarboxylase
MEGAVHSHTRRAVEAGCSTAEIRHVALLAITTIGFPSMMKTLSWVEDIVGDKS